MTSAILKYFCPLQTFRQFLPNVEIVNGQTYSSIKDKLIDIERVAFSLQHGYENYAIAVSKYKPFMIWLNINQ